MRVIGRDDVMALIDPDDARFAVRAALERLAEGAAIQPPSLGMEFESPPGELHVKGAHVLGSPIIAMKVASGFPGNALLGVPVNAGLSIALDAQTGHPLALVADGGYLTELRTGAAGAVAADALARPDARRIAILGSGQQARFQLDALRRVRPVEHVTVWSRTSTNAEAFAAEVRRDHGIECVVAARPADAVASVDVVVCATASTTALITARDLPRGVHVTAMGSDFPAKQELHVDVLATADVVVADQIANCVDSGEIGCAVRAGVLSVDDVMELGDVTALRRPGRRTADDVTVADLCGLGVEDAAVLEVVLRRSGIIDTDATEERGTT